jgi:hypothetical protein
VGVTNFNSRQAYKDEFDEGARMHVGSCVGPMFLLVTYYLGWYFAVADVGVDMFPSLSRCESGWHNVRFVCMPASRSWMLACLSAR